MAGGWSAGPLADCCSLAVVACEGLCVGCDEFALLLTVAGVVCSELCAATGVELVPLVPPEVGTALLLDPVAADSALDARKYLETSARKACVPVGAGTLPLRRVRNGTGRP